MKIIGYILLLMGIIVSNVQAQTFNAGNSNMSAAQNDQRQRINTSYPTNNISQTLKKSVDSEDTKSEKSPFLKDTTANFSFEDNSEKHDNSLGKVIRFKIVDGEVQFQEDKDRMILIYYDNYKVSKGMDNIVRCTLRLFVLNDLETKVSNLGFKLHWPEISTGLQMQNIQPGVSKYSDIMLLGNGCFTMDKTPTVEINRCRVKGLSEEQCADKVKWFSKSRQ